MAKLSEVKVVIEAGETICEGDYAKSPEALLRAIDRIADRYNMLPDDVRELSGLVTQPLDPRPTTDGWRTDSELPPPPKGEK